ncbi:unnamed protein product [Alopecurus aequalis]
MASGSEADARAAELAALSGEKIVDLLRTTYRRTDFEAAARVFKARDRRFAEVKAALPNIEALRKKYVALLDARRRTRDEAEEMAPLLGIASKDPVHRDEPRMEELEDVPLSRRLKQLRGGETSALESGKRGGQGHSNSPGTLGNYGQKSSSAGSVHSVGLKERIEQPVGSIALKDSKQGRGVVEPEKWGGGVPRTVPLVSPGLLDRTVPPKGSSENVYGRARTGKKQSSSDGILARRDIQPPKGNGKIIKRSMLESSSRSANKETGTVMKKCPPTFGQTEDRMIAKRGNPMQEASMVASSSLSIGCLSAAELRAYCLKPKPAPPASCMEIETQNVRDLAKGGNSLSKKPVDVSSKKKLVGGD